MSMNPNKVIIPCRFSYLHCWEPDSVNGGDPRYSVSAIIPKSDTRTVEKIRAAIENAKKESLSKWVKIHYVSHESLFLLGCKFVGTTLHDSFLVIGSHLIGCEYLVSIVTSSFLKQLEGNFLSFIFHTTCKIKNSL